MHIIRIGDADTPTQHFEIRADKHGPVLAHGVIEAGFASPDTFRLTYELHTAGGERPSAAAVNAFLAQRLEMAEVRDGVWLTGTESEAREP